MQKFGRPNHTGKSDMEIVISSQLNITLNFPCGNCFWLRFDQSQIFHPILDEGILVVSDLGACTEYDPRTVFTHASA